LKSVRDAVTIVVTLLVQVDLAMDPVGLTQDAGGHRWRDQGADEHGQLDVLELFLATPLRNRT